MLLIIALPVAWSCDARQSQDTVPLPPSEPSDGVGARYASLPGSLRQALELTHRERLEERLDGLRALESQLDVRALPRLVELLQDADEEIRGESTRLVGSYGAEARSAAESLSRLLDDPSPLVRQCALVALARVGGEQALEALLEFLVQPAEDEVEPAIDALGRLGRIEAVPALLPYLESDEPTLVRTAQRAITRIGPGAVQTIRPLLRSSQPSTRCAVASMLAQWESQQDVGEIARLAREDGEPSVRVCALGALGRLGDEAAVEELARILTDPASSSRERAAEALGVAATGEAVRALIRSLTSFGEGDSVNPAQAALVSIGRTVVPALGDAISTGPPLRRALIAQTLGLLGDPSAVGSLQTALMDTDPLVRQAAAAALEVLNP